MFQEQEQDAFGEGPDFQFSGIDENAVGFSDSYTLLRTQRNAAPVHLLHGLPDKGD